MLRTILAAILATSVVGESACPESVFGYVDPNRTTIVDSSVPPLVLADGFGFGPAPGGSFLYNATIGHVMHYAPHLENVPGAVDARQVFNSAGYPGLVGHHCILPGPPPNACGKYVKTVYKEGCSFFGSDAVLALGASPDPHSGVNGAGFFSGCEIESMTEYCYKQDPNGGPAIPCECPTSACPETFFGHVDPDRTTIVDSSVPPLVLADGFGFGPAPGGSFLYNATIGHVMHYAPHLSNVPGALVARHAFNNVGMPGLTMESCIIPGPPPGACGRYVKTVYKAGCPFFGSDAVLALGASPHPDAGVNSAGFFEGCEVESVTEHCYTPNPTGGAASPCECPKSTCMFIKAGYKATKCCGKSTQLCQNLKEHYKTMNCCGQPAKEVPFFEF